MNDNMDRLIADPDTWFAEKRAEAVQALADEAAGRPVRFGPQENVGGSDE